MSVFSKLVKTVKSRAYPIQKSDPTRELIAQVAIETLEDRRLMSQVMHTTFRRLDTSTAGKLVSPLTVAPVTPATLRSAYAINSVQFGSVAGDGTGQTIAIVDAYNAPTIVSDLAAFNSLYGLPSSTLTIVNQTGGTSLPGNDPSGAGNSWALETSLDVEWAHAVAPKANILLVLANSANDADLYTAVDTARNWAGVSAVSMSWGADEASTDAANDFHFTTPAGHQGVTFLASSGDAGRYSDTTPTTIIPGYPATSPNVVAVGGTRLNTTSGAWTSETGWGNGTTSGTNGGSGGGISLYEAQPSYQTGVVTQSTTKRTIPDIAMTGDPASGGYVIDSYDNGNTTPVAIGGTSLSAPLWSGIIALANQGRVLSGLGTLDGRTETLPKIYTLPAADFHDITSGNNGYAAGTGYDLVTGRGSPIANLLVSGLVGVTNGTPSIGTFAASPTAIGLNGLVTLTASNVVESGGSGTITGVTFYRESNGTSGYQAGSDTPIGAGLADGTNTWSFAASTATLSTGTQTYYAVATDSNNTTSSALSTSVTIGASGFSSWSSFSSSVAKIPVTAGQIASTSIVDFGSTLYTGALNVRNTLNRIRANGSEIDANDGSVYSNSSGDLPSGRTYYEFVVHPTTGSDHSFGSMAFPGSMRIVIDTLGDVYFTGDHYSTFQTVYTIPSNNPTIGSLAASPSAVAAGTSVTLTASSVAETGGSISRVAFYRETNSSSSLQVGTDTFIALGSATGSNWSTSISTTGLAAGTYTYYAVATDSTGFNSTVSSTTVTITAGAPTIGSFTISPTPILVGGTTNLTASNVAVTTGTISSVNFYRETNGTTGYQAGSDTLVGTGTQSGSTWTLSNLATTGQSAGTYTYYAVATDSSSVNSAASSATLTINGTGTNGALLAWNVSGQTAYGTQGLAASTVGSGVTNSTGLTRGSGVGNAGTAATGGWGGTTWNATSGAAGITANAFVTFGMTISTGYTASLASIDLNYRRSTSGAQSGLYQYQLGTGGTWTTIVDSAGQFSSSSSSGSQITQLSLAGISALQNLAAGTVVNFRIVPYGATASGGTWYVYHTTTGTITPNDLVISGSTSLVTTNGTPTIGGFTLTPSTINVGGTTTLTATNVVETGGVGTITGVSFYRETNGTSGYQAGSDTLVGTGTQASTTWTLSNLATTGLTAGTYTYYAVASDSNGSFSTASSATLTINNASAPTIGSFSATPSTVVSGDSTTLTAGAVTEVGGTISAVNFYRESNGTSGFQSDDTLIGGGTASGNDWSLSYATTGLAAGSYTLYAVATDATSISSAASSATLTVTAGGTSIPLVAWNVSGQSTFGTQGLAAGTVAAGITNSLGLTRGAGVTTTGTAASNAWGGNTWNSTSAGGITADSTVSFGLTVASGYSASISAIDLNYRRSSAGAPNGLWQFQLNGGTWTQISDNASQFSSSSSSGSSITQMNLAGISALQNLAAGTIVNFRIIPYGSTSTGGTWYVYHTASSTITPNDLVISGSTTAVGGPSPLVLTGPANYIKLNSDGLHLDLWNSIPTGSLPAADQQLLLANISSISYAGTGVDDTLAIDFSAGDPIVGSTLSFAGAGGNDKLIIKGTGASDNFSFGSSTSLTHGAKTVTFSSTETLAVSSGNFAVNTNLNGASLQASGSTTSVNLTKSQNLNSLTIDNLAAVTSASTESSLPAMVVGSLSISSGTLSIAPNGTQSGVSIFSDLSILPAGLLNLHDNDIVLNYGSNLSPITTINNLVKSGLALLGGNGFGIGSTEIDAQTIQGTMLGVVDDGDANIAGAITSTSGYTLADPAHSIIIKYTWFGDSNLDGIVDGSDYALLDSGFTSGGSLNSWVFGDYDASAIVDGSDYALIDTGFISQDRVL